MLILYILYVNILYILYVNILYILYYKVIFRWKSSQLMVFFPLVAWLPCWADVLPRWPIQLLQAWKGGKCWSLGQSKRS